MILIDGVLSGMPSFTSFVTSKYKIICDQKYQSPKHTRISYSASMGFVKDMKGLIT